MSNYRSSLDRPQPFLPEYERNDPDISLPLDKIRLRKWTRALLATTVGLLGLGFALWMALREPSSTVVVYKQSVPSRPDDQSVPLNQFQQKEEEARRRLEQIERQLAEQKHRQEMAQKAEQEARDRKENVELQKVREELAHNKAEEERRKRRVEEKRQEEEARQAWEKTPRGKKSVAAWEAIQKHIAEVQKTDPKGYRLQAIVAGSLFLRRVCESFSKGPIDFDEAERLLNTKEGQDLGEGAIRVIDDLLEIGGDFIPPESTCTIKEGWLGFREQGRKVLDSMHLDPSRSR